MKELRKPPLERKWFNCPNCGQKLLIYDNTCKSHGLFMPCKRCKKEVEIKI